MFKVAVVGLGWWGKVILPLLKTSGKIEVVKAIDADPAAAAFAAQHGVAFDTRIESALEDANVQGVVLCTPHSTHADLIVRVANAKKHVFCEKPLCMNRADVLRAVAAVNANGVALAVGPRAPLRAAGAGGVPRREERRDRHAAADRGQLQPGQVHRHGAGQLAHVAEGSAGRPDDRDRHPPARPVGRPARARRPRAAPA